MTVSLSPSVRSVVMKEFFFSLRSYRGASRKSNGCFIEVLRMFHASFMNGKFQGCFKSVSREFQILFEEVLRLFKESDKWISRKIQ